MNRNDRISFVARALGLMGRRVLIGFVLPATCLGLAMTQISSGQSAPDSVTTILSGDSLAEGQVIQQVLAKNDRAAAARFMEKSARSKIGASGAWDDPMLMLGVQNLPTSGDFNADPMTMKMLGLSWNIPYNGVRGLSRKAATADAEVSTADRESTELTLAAAAKTAYADIYYRRKAQTALAAQYELLSQVVSSVRSKLVVNQASQEELLSAQSELWKSESDLLMAEADVQKQEYDLNALRGVPADRPIADLAAPVLDTVPTQPDAWIELARANYPPLRKIAEQSKSYAFSRDAANRMRLPMFSLSGYYGFRSGYDMGVQGMAEAKRLNMIGFQGTFSIPIFSGRKQGYMARSMDAMRQSSDAELQQQARDIGSLIRSLHLYALHGRQSIALYQDRIIPASEDAFKGALAGYQTNRTPLTSVLNYAIALYRNRLAYYQLSNQYAQTMAEIYRLTTDPQSLPSPATSQVEK